MGNDRSNDEICEEELRKIISRTNDMEYRLARFLYEHRKKQKREKAAGLD